MFGMYFPPRIVRQLKAAGIESRSDLDARLDTLTDVLSARDARLVRKACGWRPPEAEQDTVEVPSSAGPVAVVIDGPELWSTRQVAEYLGLTRRTVANWCADGRIAALKLGDDWRVPRGEVERLLGAAV
jgi:excisionase family DNA binding protein